MSRYCPRCSWPLRLDVSPDEDLDGAVTEVVECTAAGCGYYEPVAPCELPPEEWAKRVSAVKALRGVDDLDARAAVLGIHGYRAGGAG
ncbi:MAG TPA: hypothetical protein VFC00_06135 [Micromonosporaceae bacterium]|nr:hypothetical protein [Micromonosporaceae bacterium]